MRGLFISFYLIFLYGCCKEEPTVAKTRNCKVVSATSSYGNHKFFNYIGNNIAGYTYGNFSTTSIQFTRDTLNVSYFDNIRGLQSLVKYSRRSDSLMELTSKSYFPTVDSSKSSFRLNDRLIVSHIYSFTGSGGNKVTDSTTYSYNPDNTLRESKSKASTTFYEYYDIIDSQSIYIDQYNNIAILSQYFNLNTKFKLLKKRTLVSGTRTDEYDYTYSFDAEKKVVSSIINTKNYSDTMQYRYLCE